VTLSWFEQIKEALMPSRSRHRVVENPIAAKIEREIERRFPEPTDMGHYQIFNSTRHSYSRRGHVGEDEAATFDDSDEEEVDAPVWDSEGLSQEEVLLATEDDNEVIKDAFSRATKEASSLNIMLADEVPKSAKADKDKTPGKAEEAGWSDSSTDNPGTSKDDSKVAQKVLDSLVPGSEDDEEKETDNVPVDEREEKDDKSDDDDEVLGSDDQNMDENNDKVEEHDDLPEEKPEEDNREVEKDTQKRFSDLCKGKLDDEGTCEIKDEVIQLKDNTFFKDNKIVSLVFNNTKIECSTGKAHDQFCEITFELNHKVKKKKRMLQQAGTQTDGKKEEEEVIVQPMLSLVNGSEIRARSVFVLIPTGRLIVDGSSGINTDGTSREVVGSDDRHKQGASHAGQGGYCGPRIVFKDLTFGRFDDKCPKAALYHLGYRKDFAGSVGMMNKKASEKWNVLTGGGGRVHIDVDSVKF